MPPPIDETEQILRDVLAELWSELVVETELLGYLVVLSVRPPLFPLYRAPELRLSWIRGEGHVVATIHQDPSSRGHSIRVDVPGGVARVVAEAGARELRKLVDASGGT